MLLRSGSVQYFALSLKELRTPRIFVDQDYRETFMASVAVPRDLCEDTPPHRSCDYLGWSLVTKYTPYYVAS